MFKNILLASTTLLILSSCSLNGDFFNKDVNEDEKHFYQKIENHNQVLSYTEKERVLEPNLIFYNVNDEYDIEIQLSSYIKKCDDGNGRICFLTAKYFEKENDKYRAFEFYQKACNRNQKEACAYAKYLNL